uniref:Uncharacterized protein LOC102809342 n=1 Tax=Saccoglossus kowalevskii TaxID=10224 RepID=A0ABM0MJ37_SACKO|nr:PREDICTED: uncharacterized protein LOC102809342 [Saccoglossus kowalevskii]
MKCRICRKSGKRNPFTDADGCKNYRTSTVARHASSALHLEAVKATIMRADMEAAVSTALTKKQDAVITAMKTVYWLAKEAIATDKYSSLLELLRESGCEHVGNLQVGGNATYQSSTTAEDLQQTISDVITTKVSKRIQSCVMFSILTDESTDISVTGRLVLYIRMVNEEFDVESHFLGNYHLLEKDAASITDKLVVAVQQRELDARKMMGWEVTEHR